MPWIGGAISAGASLLGGAMSSGSASNAANEQAAATQAAIAEQRRQYDQTRADQAPWRDAGSASVNRLKYLLGLGGSGTDRESLRESLLPQFTRQETTQGDGYWTPGYGAWGDFAAVEPKFIGNQTTTNNVVDENGLNAAIDAQSANPNDPEYGSLNRKFTLADFWDDPVTKASYQMGLDQGTKSINNMAGARGGRNSGATLKALTRFGTDYTGQQAAGSQQRYEADKASTYNRYAGLSGTGQVATQATSAAGQNAANNISGLTSSLGNARGASAIAQGNAWQGAANNIGNWFGQQNMLSNMTNGGNVSSGYNYVNPYNTSDAENYGGYI